MTSTRYPQTNFRIPDGSTDVLLIRHGQSAAMAAEGDYPKAPDGQADPELSEEGRHQAELLGQRLAVVGIVAIYTSTLRRTHQTAAPLAERTGLKPEEDVDLCEIRLGEWEGGEYRRRVERRDPMMFELMAKQSWSVIPGAESDEVFGGRIRAGLSRIQAAHPGQRVAVVCHGGVIGQVVALATGASPLAFMHVDNASISQVILHGEHWIVRRFNDTTHLGPAFPAASEPVI